MSLICLSTISFSYPFIANPFRIYSKSSFLLSKRICIAVLRNAAKIFLTFQNTGRCINLDLYSHW